MTTNWPEGYFEDTIVPKVRTFMDAKTGSLVREDREDLVIDAQTRVWLDHGCLELAVRIVEELVPDEGKDGAVMETATDEAALAAQLDSFLWRCVNNTWYDYLRARGTQKRSRYVTIVLGDDRGDNGGSEARQVPDDALTPEEQAHVEKLPPAQREATQLWLQDFSIPEIAEHLGIAENTTRQRLHAARQTLRGRYREEHTDGR